MPGTISAVELGLGIRIHLRDVETFDDLADVTAPAPIELTMSTYA